MAIPIKTRSPHLLDKHGNIIRSSQPPVTKQMFGEFGSIYEYPNIGRFHPRVYTNQDQELGVNQYNRDLLLRWSREMAAQQPWIWSGVKLLSLFSVGKEYEPRYCGDNSQWGENACKWLKQEFYPRCCSRGPNYDFQTIMGIISENMDVDGDILLIFGEDFTGPKFQLIPSHRIRTIGSAPFEFPANEAVPKQGPYPNTTVSDGVVYDMEGTPLAYSVQNLQNMVNSAFSVSNGASTFVSTRNSRLVYMPRFPDRGRGLPTISSGILQAISVEEIEAYLTEKLKIQSMYAVIEKTPEGEGPYEEEQAYQRAASTYSSLQGFSIDSQSGTNSSQGLRIVQNPAIKYVSCAGGDIKFPEASITNQESSDFLTRLETHVLGCLGVPHALLFSQDDVAGKMNNSVIDIFNSSICKRQQLLDFHGKFILGWALAKAIKNGDLPPNDDEFLTHCFEFTHPPVFTLESSKNRQDDLASYELGTMTLEDIAKKRNTNAKAIMSQMEVEQIEFWNSVNRIAKATNTDPTLVAQSMKEKLKAKAPPI